MLLSKHIIRWYPTVISLYFGAQLHCSQVQLSLGPEPRVWGERHLGLHSANRRALLPGTESHCSPYNGEHSFAFRVRLGPGIFILLLLPGGNVDTVSLEMAMNYLEIWPSLHIPTQRTLGGCQ